MPCIVKKTLETIMEKKDHYLVCVKKNRRHLYNKMAANTLEGFLRDSYCTLNEKNRGRIETRNVRVFEVSAEIQKDYPHSRSVIKVNRERTIKGKKSEEVVYYLSDLTVPAKEFYDGIRGHWSIENKLHYVKDVVMNEDKANLKNKLIAPLLSILRSFVIMIAKLFDKSVTSFQRTYAHNLDLILVL
jgi:predicted transposase YbfD/YdcC